MKPKKFTPNHKAMIALTIIGVEAIPILLFIRVFLASTELSFVLSSKNNSLSLFIKRIAISNVNKAMYKRATLI